MGMSGPFPFNESIAMIAEASRSPGDRTGRAAACHVVAVLPPGLARRAFLTCQRTERLEWIAY